MQLDLVLEPDSPARFRELGLLAEQLGFGQIWTANHIAARDPFMAFMPLAAASTRVGMGPVAVSPYELHPVKIAAQLATLNEAAPGRAAVVIGGGGGTVIGLGMKADRRTMMPRMVRAVRETVEFVRGAVSGEPFSYAGELFRVQGYTAAWARGLPAPAIHVGASKPQMLRMAARVADGVMLSDVTLPRITETMAVLSAALRLHGRDSAAFPVSNLYAWHVREDRAAAEAEARAKLFVRGMLENWYISPFLEPGECAEVEAGFAAFAAAYARNSPVIEGVRESLVAELVRNLTFTGTPADIDTFLREMLEFRAAGVTRMAIRLYDEPVESMRLLAARVMPALSA